MTFFVPRWERFKDKKPTTPQEIDWSNELTDGLVLAAYPSEPKTIDLVAQQVSSRGAQNAIYIGDDGLVTRYDNNYDAFPGTPLETVSEYSVTMRCGMDNTSSWGWSGLFGKINHAANFLTGFKVYNYWGSNQFNFSNLTTDITLTGLYSALISAKLSTFTLNVDKSNLLSLTHEKNTLLSLINVGVTTPGVGDFLVFGNTDVQQSYGQVAFTLAHARSLSSDEIVALHEAPYQILKPHRKWFIFGSTTTTSTSLTPTLLTNQNTLLLLSVQTTTKLSPSLVTNTSTEFTPTVVNNIAISPALFTETNTFLSQTAGTKTTLTPQTVVNNQTFFSTTVGIGNNLAPQLVVNSNTLFSPIAKTKTSLTPQVVTNIPTFLSATIGTGGNLVPQLVTNVSYFFSPTVKGKVTLQTGLETNTSTLFSPSIVTGVNLSATLVNNQNSLFNPTVSTATTVTPSLLYNQSNIFSQVVTTGITLSPNLLANPSNILFPLVNVSGSASISPNLYVNNQTLYPATVNLTKINLAASLVTSSPTIYSAVITTGKTLQASVFLNNTQLFAPNIFKTDKLLPTVLANQSVFYSSIVTAPVAITLTPNLVVNSSVFYLPNVNVPSVSAPYTLEYTASLPEPYTVILK